MDIGGAQFEAGVVFGVVALLVTGTTGVIAGNLVHNFLHPYDRVPREASRSKKQKVHSRRSRPSPSRARVKTCTLAIYCRAFPHAHHLRAKLHLFGGK